MSDDDTLRRVAAIARQLSPAPPAAVLAETRLLDDLQIDSLKVAEMSILLEDEFGISIFLPELLTTVEDPHELTVGALASFVSEGRRRARG